MKKKKSHSKSANREVYPNLTVKELDRDIINLHLEEPDLIMDSEEERIAYLKKIYSKDFLESVGIK